MLVDAFVYCRLMTLRLESKEVPKRVDTERRPKRPRPSLRTQLMPAAAGNDFLAPTPTACRRDCMATSLFLCSECFFLGRAETCCRAQGDGKVQGIDELRNTYRLCII